MKIVCGKAFTVGGVRAPHADPKPDPVRTTAESNATVAVALHNLLEHYTTLVNCGDAGRWDPEKEPVVIAARAALSTPATTGEGEVERHWRNRIDEVLTHESQQEPELYNLSADGLAREIAAALAALPHSSGWVAGAEAMRSRVLDLHSSAIGHWAGRLGSAPDQAKAMIAIHERGIVAIRALPLPPPPSSGEK